MLEGYVHPDFAKVAATLNRQIPKDRPGGAAVCIYHRGEKVVDIWGGTRDREGNPWQADTLSFSFSTTKGIASTLLHTLVDDGLVDYDQPVARYWPEFAQAGKQNITVRQVMCHEAGLYHIREMIDHADLMLDWEFMTRTIAEAQPIHDPGAHNGYHGLTYGWIVGEIAQRVTGKSFSQLIKERLADPLELDGLYVGLPEDQMYRRAKLIQGSVRGEGRPSKLKKYLMKAFTLGMKMTTIDLDDTFSALMPKGIMSMDMNAPEVVQACMPSINGMFTARSLARLYAALANGGEFEGVRILSADTLRKATRVQNTTLGRVVPVPMRWRLGYHRAFALGHRVPGAFGHFGFGGSGAWADPKRKLSVAMTLNSGVGTPFGDLRILNINNATLSCTENRRVWVPLQLEAPRRRITDQSGANSNDVKMLETHSETN
ncbi:MAG TPA: serine hydrolase domain-containing protein [Pseudomonadales bacterium]|nr:serine hydrolase domain-containing protein [Pseudomonadales bacterium]